MAFKIAVVGLGKLGLPVAVAMASRGADVTGFDINNKNMSKEPRPYQEAGPDGTGNFDDWLAESTIRFAPLQETVADKDIVFLAVQTPHDPLYEGITPLPDSRADFDYRFLKNAVRAIVPHMTFGSVLTIISTVLPGTVRREILPLVKSESGIGVVYNPSFIAMGVTMTDFLYPEFILIGGDQDWARVRVGDFYRTILPRVPIQRMTLESAELTKVAYNTLISQKIAFANATMEISHYLNGDCDQVIDALSLATKRIISPDYLRGGMADGGGCLPTGGLVLAEDGPRAIETIQVGERVLARDGRLHPVIKKWHRPYEGKMLGVRCEGQPPAHFTSDHPMIVANDGRPICPGGKQDTRAKAVDLLSEEIEVPAANLKVGQFIPTAIPNEVEQVDLPGHVTKAYCEISGWYLSEGTLEMQPGRNGRIGFHLNRAELSVAERLAGLLLEVSPPKQSGRGAGAKPTISYRGENSLALRYGSLKLAEILNADFGHGAAEKRLPSWAVYGPEWACKAIMRGMWQGDGHSSQFGMFLATISENMAYQAQLVLHRFGVPSTLREIAPRVGKDGLAHRKSFEVRVRNERFYDRMVDLTGLDRPPSKPQKLYTRYPERDGALYRKVLNIEEFDYVGDVWNLWIDGDHTYATPIGIVHNCHPRDNIAMSWLARDLDLSHDIFEDTMKAREDQTRWLADLCKTISAKENLPIVIMGFAYKPNSNLTAGSPALLLYELLDHRAKLYDPHVQYFEPHEMPIDPAVFLIGCKHACFVNHDWPEGSVVIDPHRYIPDREGVNVIRIGQHRPSAARRLEADQVRAS